MRTLLNTLYVTTPGSYLQLDHETVKIELNGTIAKQIPLHHINKIVLFGTYFISPQLIEKCMVNNKDIVLLNRNGRFVGNIVGPLSGNVLLRRAQHIAYENTELKTLLCKCFVAGKLQTCRLNLIRFARELSSKDSKKALNDAATTLQQLVQRLKSTNNLDEIRGIEGIAAKEYYKTFNLNIKNNNPHFYFTTRNRRPPLDPFNALLSFLYTLVRIDCHSALETVGLDPQVGFLHTIRPGRPALALDLMEEFRPIFADRLAFALINKKQLDINDFNIQVGGPTWLNDKGRIKVIIEYQKRKENEFTHPYLNQKIPFGLLPFVQARLLAQCLRGDIEFYPTCIWR